MKASQSLRKPANWQDFESLCKTLWGEIWKCPEIIKNGRRGQIQHGVDIYGIPSWDNEYYGIQCKGKDEYTHAQFTETEISNEIEKVKGFQPPLKKLYLATTANKDTKIEEFIRNKNLENKRNSLFEVHIFSWEDIVDLIDENQSTHDYYVNSINFKTAKSVSITFQNGLTEIILTPKFREIKSYFVNEVIAKSIPKFDGIIFNFSDPIKINLSYVRFYFIVTNTGHDPIDEYKVLFEFKGKIIKLSDSNEIENSSRQYLIPSKILPTIFIHNETKSIEYIPHKRTLVGDDYVSTRNLYLKPQNEDSEITIKWKLISRHLKQEGELKIIINPEIEIEKKAVPVPYPSNTKPIADRIEDYIIDKPKQ